MTKLTTKTKKNDLVRYLQMNNSPSEQWDAPHSRKELLVFARALQAKLAADTVVDLETAAHVGKVIADHKAEAAKTEIHVDKDLGEIKITKAMKAKLKTAGIPPHATKAEIKASVNEILAEVKKNRAKKSKGQKKAKKATLLGVDVALLAENVSRCERCDKTAELSHDDETGEALCDKCLKKGNDPKPAKKAAKGTTTRKKTRVGNIPLMKSLIKSKATDAAVLKVYTDRYVAQGGHKADPTWIQARVDIYTKIAQEELTNEG